MSELAISNVSDTARWVAVYRAWETARPDALFRDPFAERLAGERGKQIVASIRRPGGTGNGWPMITRTKLIDDLVLASLAGGCDCVLNLAAGLDSRPYRLQLPASLNWVEVDLPAITEEKERALAGETPVCSLRRVKLDLADVPARRALFDEVARDFKKVLVLTEGLVLYLDESAVRELALDLAARKTFHFWMLDVLGPRILQMMMSSMGRELQNAPFKFAPPNGVAFYEALGWAPREIRSLFHEGVRFKRVPWFMRPFALFPPPDPRNPGNRPWSAIVRFEQQTV
ncbi:MAG TPA: SAM-dependent methyltransferase [Polyangiaceae bacterium]|jgi:methyltransferase (TIGR00027 family)